VIIMKIPNEINTATVIRLISAQAERTSRHATPAESTGHLTKEVHNLLDMQQLSNGKVSTAVFQKWIDIAVVAVKACELYEVGE